MPRPLTTPGAAVSAGCSPGRRLRAVGRMSLPGATQLLRSGGSERLGHAGSECNGAVVPPCLAHHALRPPRRASPSPHRPPRGPPAPRTARLAAVGRVARRTARTRGRLSLARHGYGRLRRAPHGEVNRNARTKRVADVDAFVCQSAHATQIYASLRWDIEHNPILRPR